MEFVSYIETRKGKKLLKVFKSKRAVDMFLKKNTDKILSKSGIEKVGSMSKRDWDSKEAKYAVNEASKEAMGIAGFTGTRGVAVDDFIKKNNIDARKLFNFVKKGSLRDRMDFVTALAGKPNNKFFKMIVGKFSESVNEGKKRFKRQDGIGKAKYTISFHDGKKKHKDGSDFFDIKIFKNKKDLSDFVGTLVKQGYKLTRESVNEKINPKFYDARVQYTDPKNKKKFVGDVVRYDNGEYEVNLGKDGRFEKYILAKEKDLKIVSKSKKKTFESVNENSQARSLYIQIYKRHGKNEKKFYDRLEYLEKKMGKREFDIVIDNGLRGFKQNPKKYKTDAAKQERLFQLVKQAAK